MLIRVIFVTVFWARATAFERHQYEALDMYRKSKAVKVPTSLHEALYQEDVSCV